MNAIMQRPVIAGWPESSVGNEPSGCCWLASQLSARRVAVSTRRHWAGVRTFAGVVSSVGRDDDEAFVAAALGERKVCCARVSGTATSRLPPIIPITRARYNIDVVYL